MVSQTILSLERKYKNSTDKVMIGRDFIAPCLKECIKYRRGTGTFGSSAFKAYAEAVDHMVDDKVIIEILCSPKIDRNLFETLKKCQDEDSRIQILEEASNKLVLKACKINPNRSDYRAKLIAWLIANGKLVIRFALPLKTEEITIYEDEDEDGGMSNVKNQAMYHIKYGYFEFPDEIKIAFAGSMNETDTSHSHSTEQVIVFRSWDVFDKQRLEDVIEDLDNDWEGKNPGIRVKEISKKTLEEIKDQVRKDPKRPQKPPHKPAPPQPPAPKPIDPDANKWRHKDEALKVFMDKKVGILAMATGTGKTSTAIKIANHLFDKELIDSVVITMYGNPLLAQWDTELLDDEEINKKSVIRHYNTYRDMQAFISRPKNNILLITRDSLGDFFDHFQPENAKRTLIIYDEVHDFAAPTTQERTKGKHKKFTYRLGLSATPDRGKFDEEGSEFLYKEIGPIIFKFPIEDAIKRGVLVEFDYKALSFDLTDEENKKISGIIGSQHSPGRDGKKRSQKEIMLAISDVTKLAENKLLAFDHYLKDKGTKFLDRSIIYVHTKEYGQQVMEILNDHHFTGLNHLFEDGDATATNLQRIANETITCLITCHKASQGIDIKSLNSIIIFASSVNPRETIQRLGRALRTEQNNPNKKAFLLDFCVNDEQKDGNLKSDTTRKEWLTELSKSKKEE